MSSSSREEPGTSSHGDFGFSGILGRSQGCFAVAGSSLPEIMARLGPGRLIYADKAKEPV